MRLPQYASVMTLSDAVLFPGAVVPLRIFEPRYRQMLSDALEGDRLFALAMRQDSSLPETACKVAGLGLIRACVSHDDGTYHVMLQGLARIELGEIVHRRPYRVLEIAPLETIIESSPRTDALLTRLVNLVEERLDTGLVPLSLESDSIPLVTASHALEAFRTLIRKLSDIDHSEEMVDLISGALLQDPLERQLILEAQSLGTRLQRLVRFLTRAIRRQEETDSL